MCDSNSGCVSAFECAAMPQPCTLLYGYSPLSVPYMVLGEIVAAGGKSGCLKRNSPKGIETPGSKRRVTFSLEQAQATGTGPIHPQQFPSTQQSRARPGASKRQTARVENIAQGALRRAAQESDVEVRVSPAGIGDIAKRGRTSEKCRSVGPTPTATARQRTEHPTTMTASIATDAVRRLVEQDELKLPSLADDDSPVVSEWATACFAEGPGATVQEVSIVVAEAKEAARNDFDANSANEWAQGYVFPSQYVESDARCLQAAQLDFTTMVRRRLKTLSIDRLSSDRVERLRADNPERVLLLDLAQGMRVPIPTGFEPNGLQPQSPLRPTYEAVSAAVNKMLGSVVEQRLAFLIPLDMARRYVPKLHLCKAHWTTKKGKPSGRPLGDLSYVDGTPLNTEETAAAATAYYGLILHPTIEDIAVMIHQFWTEALLHDPHADIRQLRIWKMDLKGAYTLLSFRPEDVGLFGMLLTGGLVYFQIAGIFGWSGTPAAFQVVTRAITWELRHKLRSRTLMYVDDVIGVCFAEDVDEDLRVTRAVCTDLLGSGAVADDKTEVGRRLDVIGYTVDLDSQRVLIARKNYLTALHGFMTTDLRQRINLRTAQRLASWGTRCGKICRVMRPFCGALNRLTQGRTDPHAMFSLSQEAQVAIQCWQAMLCLVRYRETEFTRTLDSFSSSTPTILVEFDSSLSGAGLIWFQRSNGAEAVRGVNAVDLTFLGFGEDSSYQNLAEFIGAILAVVGQVVLGHTGMSLALRGDSVTALTWAITERPRGSIVTKAAMVWSMLCIATGIDVQEITHLPGKDNERCDRLSRRGTQSDRDLSEDLRDMGLQGSRVIVMNEVDGVPDLLRLCDPKEELKTDAEFVAFWMTARRAIARITNTYHPYTLSASTLSL